jgi:hypothetical protein
MLINQCHWIEFSTITAPHSHTSRLIRKATKTSLHNNFNGKGGYQISPAWKNIILVLKEQRAHHSHNQTKPVTTASTT